jgi:hydroxymethylpyrimidine pyrophosphatase-like HAD family hydrolase
VHFVVATARSVMMFEPLADNIGDNGVAICSNGA